MKLDESPPPGVPAYAEGEFERDLLRLCRRQKLSPIVANSLMHLALPPGLSRIALQRLNDEAVHIDDNNARLSEKLGLIVSSFRKKGIPCMACGEAVYATDLYPLSNLRAVEKIDLLVREGDWVGIEECLRTVRFEKAIGRGAIKTPDEALQFHQFYAPCVYRDADGDRIRVFFRVFDFGRPEANEKAWNRAREAGALAGGGKILGVEDELIRAAMELNILGFGNLLLITDVALLLVKFGRQTDWGYLEERLRSSGLYPAVYFTIQHVGDFLKVPRLWEVLRHPGRIRQRIFENVWGLGNKDFYNPGRSARTPLVFHMIERQGLAERISVMRRILFPNSNWVNAFFGRQCNGRLRIEFIGRALGAKWEDGVEMREAHKSA
ncbi:MAG: hypothetical protein GTO51_07255 [Candidatus Latescibacteria bacterium]|nr:hypothetical protein [Candidatus Latescibacterota bacterium]NIM22291.1 hypothetical protein [Candidatus Latescibacterota bacterium]NIM65770.1 hypothetical protein [Candidatus Latescibacterota bacterium]NIO02155.1 hypothetical protein [Candidatus Latescibacterota bacterium]NIO28987.1 hypothetical protein [Candidatus Latescibacterota bacterium]